MNRALTHPRDGTTVAQGEDLNAEAILSGSGTVIGQWVWDGNVVEQFAASIVGGQSTTIRTRQSLPTWYLGAHTLYLRMVEPNQIATRPIVVVVNPGDWRLEQLVLPESNAAFASENPPSLLWSPVPGAAKYQGGFSTQPYLSTVRNWIDVVDNRWEIPLRIWKSLPEGQLYWTVRAIESTGEPRKLLPMRLIYRVPAGGLAATRAVPARSATGHTLLEWKPAQAPAWALTEAWDPQASRQQSRFPVNKPVRSAYPARYCRWLLSPYRGEGAFSCRIKRASRGNRK